MKHSCKILDYFYLVGLVPVFHFTYCSLGNHIDSQDKYLTSVDNWKMSWNMYINSHILVSTKVKIMNWFYQII